MDIKMKSLLTGFITIPDSQFQTLETPNGRVEFVEFIGVTDDELQSIINKENDVRSLYQQLGCDITDYQRQSVLRDKQKTYLFLFSLLTYLYVHVKICM